MFLFNMAACVEVETRLAGTTRATSKFEKFLNHVTISAVDGI
jgi:hypothetical protein